MNTDYKDWVEFNKALAVLGDGTFLIRSYTTETSKKPVTVVFIGDEVLPFNYFVIYLVDHLNPLSNPSEKSVFYKAQSTYGNSIFKEIALQYEMALSSVDEIVLTDSFANLILPSS